MRNKIKSITKKAIKGTFILSSWSLVVLFIYMTLIKSAIKKGIHETRETN